MRAEGVKQCDVVGRDIGQAGQQPGDKAGIGRGAGNVREDNADPGSRLQPLAQWAGGDDFASAASTASRSSANPGVCKGSIMVVRPSGQVHRQMTVSVSKVDLHLTYSTWSNAML